MQTQSKRFYPTLTLARDHKGRYRKIIAVQRTVFQPVVHPVSKQPIPLLLPLLAAFGLGFMVVSVLPW